MSKISVPWNSKCWVIKIWSNSLQDWEGNLPSVLKPPFKKQTNMQSGTMLTLWLFQSKSQWGELATGSLILWCLNQESTFYHWAESHKSSLTALNNIRWKVQCPHLNIYTAYNLTEARLYPAVTGPSCWKLAWGKQLQLKGHKSLCRFWNLHCERKILSKDLYGLVH